MKRRTVWSVAAVTAILLLGASGFVLLSGFGSEEEPRRLAGYEVVYEMTGHRPAELPVPTTVSEASWVWEGPRLSDLLEILPVPTGAVLHLNDGAIGLDTSTGEEVWSYRLLESEAEVTVSPDGTLVAVSANGSLALLDSGTGEELRVLEHGRTGANHLSLQDAGLVADEGLVVAGDDSLGGITVALNPWGGESGWRNEELECVEESGYSRIEDGFLSPSGIVVVYECGAADPLVVSLDLATGEEQWRLVQGQGFVDEYEHYETFEGESFAPVGDVAVLQNMAKSRGTVVINTRTGDVVSDTLPNERGNDILRILPDGYLAVRSTPLGAGEWEVRFEIRDFSGEVRDTAVTDDSNVGSTLSGQLPLKDSLLKLRWSKEEENMQVVVFDWNDEGQEEEITLPVKINLSEIASVWRVEEAVGPGTFQEVPGAVLVREYMRGELTPRVAGLT